MSRNVEQESVIDFPRESLCPDVWDFQDGTWSMKPEVKNKLEAMFSVLCRHAKVAEDIFTFCVTGSITSNTYSDQSDVDVHVRYADSGRRIREMAKMTQSRFKQAFEEVKAMHPELCSIGKHPVEVYYQPNPFQDLMSVGCYHVSSGKWLVGPEMKAQDWDPYAKIVPAAMRQSRKILEDIRSVIFEVYENAQMLLDAEQEGSGSAEELNKRLNASIDKAINLFEAAKKARKAYSDPKSEQQALKWRNSDKWKTTDASFKLMDKFGYLAALKAFAEAKDGGSERTDLASKAIAAVGKIAL